MKHQPVIIEVTHIKGDNEISFSLRGSLEWMNEMMPFLQFNLGYTAGKIWNESNEEQRAELVAGVNALQNHESFQGETVKVHIAQENPNEPR